MAKKILKKPNNRFFTTEQRLRFFDRVKKVNYKKPLQYTKGIPGFIRNRPFTAFFITLALLALLIILGSTVFKAKPLEEHKGEEIKQVETFKIGSSPKITVQAEVEKTGVIKIVAQTPGIVSSINTYEGEIVSRGKALINLSNNYYGGNAASLARQIAQNQFNLSRDTLETQKEVIQKQKQIAEKSDNNSDEMRDIANRSLEETRSLLDLNESLLNTLNASLPAIEASNSGGLNNPAVFQAYSQKSQLQSGVNQLRQAVRNTELQAAGDRPPAELSNLQREIALKNLEIQDKSLQMGHEIAKLQLALAQVNEASMYPTTPFQGVVEKVHVRVGDSVNPGTVLVTISGVEGKIILDAKVPSSTAKNLSKLESSHLTIKGQTIELMPAYVSSEATSGQLYSVIYHVPDEYQEFFTDGGFVSVSIPVGSPDTNSVVPFLPLDSIFQTQEESTVYIVKDGAAQARKIQLGEVQGGFVAVMEGIGAEDEIILSRNVVEGDKVKTN
jgi:multidrug efflux pump subunit AcrA (membrane-fusion protein)